jgi:hypothetical protein
VLVPPLPVEPPVIDVPLVTVLLGPPLSLEQPVTARQAALPATTITEIIFVVRIGKVPFEKRKSSAFPKTKPIKNSGGIRTNCGVERGAFAGDFLASSELDACAVTEGRASPSRRVWPPRATALACFSRSRNALPRE